MSQFVVSARKYRPVRFSDVVGQEHVSRTLKNAFQHDKLAHAFLFCGPRGVGKTTCARILAKVLNCQNPTENFEPCNTCASCTAFNDNASFNIIELDAASNNSVEHIRALIEQVRFQPQQGKYKIFIIDEVHMLSTQAFNAFLKTLEEPPSYAIFILATTEKHKIIPTILSRCQIFDFRRIQVPEMVAHLEGICQQENIQADQDALHVIAQKADGALRDALSIFDRMVSYAGDHIHYEDVIHNLNVLDYDYYFQLVDALLSEDANQVMLLFDDILRKGFEPDIFINGLAEHLRNLLVTRDEQTIVLLETSESLKERYLQQARLSTPVFLLTALNLINDCDIQYKTARNKRLHVELSLLKMSYIHRVATNSIPAPSPPPVEKKNPERTSKVSTAAPVVVDRPTESSAPPPGPTREAMEVANAKPQPNHLRKLSSLSRMVEEVRQEEAAHSNAQEVPLSLEGVTHLWEAFAEQSDQNALRSAMRSAQLALEGRTLKVSVGSVFSENTIRQENALMDFLRASLNRPNLQLQIIVDKNMQGAVVEEPVQKPLSDKEKYQKMLEVNGLVHDLLQRFDLKLDHET